VRFGALSLALLAVVAPVRGEPCDTPACIPEAAMTLLQEQAAEVEQTESTVEKRRLLKRVARSSRSLLETHAGAPNRFRLLGLVFQAQQELLML